MTEPLLTFLAPIWLLPALRGHRCYFHFHGGHCLQDQVQDSFHDVRSPAAEIRLLPVTTQCCTKPGYSVGWARGIFYPSTDAPHPFPPLVKSIPPSRLYSHATLLQKSSQPPGKKQSISAFSKRRVHPCASIDHTLSCVTPSSAHALSPTLIMS